MPEELAEQVYKLELDDDDGRDLPTLLDYFGTTDTVKIHIDILDALKAHDEYSYNEALFPYKAEGPLETPLPTVHEIHAAVQAGWRPEREVPNSLSVRIGPYFIKVGLRGIVMREAEKMIYLEKNSAIRIPKLYAAFSSREVDLYDLNEEGGPPLYHYLIQECIQGVELWDLFDDLALRQNFKIARKLGEIMAKQLGQLRNTPPEDPNHFGRVNGQPLNSFTTTVIFPENIHCPTYGPFTYNGIVERMLHSAKIAGATNYSRYFIEEEMLRNARGPLLDHTTPNDRLPVLSHMDIHCDNILVKVTRSEKPGEERKILDIEEVVWIDWETLAWMPGWYEAGRMFMLARTSPHNLWSHFAIDSLEHIGHIKVVPFTYFVGCLGCGALR